MGAGWRRTWKDRFVDARFSAAEATEWERLVGPEPTDDDRDAATAEMLRRRREARA